MVPCLFVYTFVLLRMLHGKVILYEISSDTAEDVTVFFEGGEVMLYMSSSKAFKIIFQNFGVL